MSSFTDRLLGIKSEQNAHLPKEPRPGPVMATGTQETHGIDPGDPIDPPSGYDDGYAHVVSDPVPYRPEPIPVTIVNDETSSDEVKNWRVILAVADATPRVMFNRSRSRTRLTVKNTTENLTVLVGPDSSVSSTYGYPIAAGASIDFTTTEEIWAVSADGEPASLVGLVEYTVNV